MLIAFGRFLRLLRERAGLSLDRVESLTAAYPEPVSKAYLSRTENGHSRIAFSRMIALCRAYEYPIDAASERLWLDLGVDKMSEPPRTGGKDARDLLREGRDHIRRGYRWSAYACARDAIASARSTPVSETLRDHDEQFAICLMNTATAASKLGRFRFALAEYAAIESLAPLEPGRQALLNERFAVALKGLGRIREAKVRADRAIDMANQAGSREFLGDCLTTRALIAASENQHGLAQDLCRAALRHHKATKDDHEAANVLANLAQMSFDRGSIGAARRFLDAANRYAVRLRLLGVRARILILLGEIHQRRDEDDVAERCWKEAQRLVSQLGDVLLTFKAKYFLYSHAARRNRPATARRLEKALDRLAPWIPVDTAELIAFRERHRRSADLERNTEFPSRNASGEVPATHGRVAP
jgi:tetratricopeptide (TPR) repeat protein